VSHSPTQEELLISRIVSEGGANFQGLLNGGTVVLVLLTPSKAQGKARTTGAIKLNLLTVDSVRHKVAELTTRMAGTV
jgi:hypothetical protein